MVSAGIWYLLCLPGGYLFLLIYSFCNINDQSWGTREAAKKQQARSNSFFDKLLDGCGMLPNESTVHFMGRALCCRSNTSVETRTVPEAVQEVKKTRQQKYWQLSEDGKRHRCYSANDCFQ